MQYDQHGKGIEFEVHWEPGNTDIYAVLAVGKVVHNFSIRDFHSAVRGLSVS